MAKPKVRSYANEVGLVHVLRVSAFGANGVSKPLREASAVRLRAVNEKVSLESKARLCLKMPNPLDAISQLALDSPEVVNCAFLSAEDYLGKEWKLIHLAAKLGRADVVEKLLSLDASPEATTSRGTTVFHIACEKGDLILASLLCKRGLRYLSVRPDSCGVTPIVILKRPCADAVLAERRAKIMAMLTKG